MSQFIRKHFSKHLTHQLGLQNWVVWNFDKICKTLNSCSNISFNSHLKQKWNKIGNNRKHQNRLNETFLANYNLSLLIHLLNSIWHRVTISCGWSLPGLYLLMCKSVLRILCKHQLMSPAGVNINLDPRNYQYESSQKDWITVWVIWFNFRRSEWTRLSCTAQTVTPKGWFILKQNTHILFLWSWGCGKFVNTGRWKKERKLTLSSDAIRGHNVQTFSCVNCLFKYLHIFICDSLFSCFLFETVGRLESNLLCFLERRGLLPCLPAQQLFTLQVYRGQLWQQTCVADVALPRWEVSSRGCTTW